MQGRAHAPGQPDERGAARKHGAPRGALEDWLKRNGSPRGAPEQSCRDRRQLCNARISNVQDGVVVQRLPKPKTHRAQSCTQPDVQGTGNVWHAETYRVVWVEGTMKQWAASDPGKFRVGNNRYAGLLTCFRPRSQEPWHVPGGQQQIAPDPAQFRPSGRTG